MRRRRGGKIVHRWGKLRPCATWCPLQFLTATAAATAAAAADDQNLSNSTKTKLRAPAF